MRIQSNSLRCWLPALAWQKPIISTLCVVIAAMFTLVATAQEPNPAPPQVYIDTTWNPPIQGGTWTVNSSSTFQLALNMAQPGDTIVLNNSSVYSGNFTLPAKTNPNNQWIYIESSALANLPPPGTRVSPTDEPNMAKIVTPNGSPALNPLPGANHYRLVGLEVTTASNQGCIPHNVPPVNCYTYFLFGQPDGGLGHPTQLPDSITFDRVYMHGSPTQDVREGIQGNVTNLAVIDSYISDIHQGWADSQAIAVYFTPGPIKVVNNFLSASTEDMMFGGSGGYSNPYVPSDIEIRRNHFFKPLSWDSCGAGGTLAPGFMKPDGTICPPGGGYQWLEKNNLEFKSARRVIVSGNLFENNWYAAPGQYAQFLFEIRTTQSGSNAVVDDIEAVSNILMHGDRGFNTLEGDYACLPPTCTNPGESKRVWIHNNLILLNPNPDDTHHVWALIWGGEITPPVLNGLTDWVFQHNTALMLDGSKMDDYVFTAPTCTTTRTSNVWLLDNVIARQPTGDCLQQGLTGLNLYIPNPSPLAPRYLGNVMFAPSGDTVYTWPAHNYATTVPFTYVDPGNGDYQLLSPDWTDTTDGKISGIDWDELQQAMGHSTLSVTTTSLPEGNSGVAYSATLAATGGTAPYSWSITDGSLPTGLSLDSGTGIISGTPTAAGIFDFTARVADSASPPNVASAGLGITITQTPQHQTITFPNPGTQTYGVVPIALTATASSGLSVTYTVISGPAMVSGNVLTIIGAGLVTVEADQPGNEDWLPAPPVRDSFTVNKAVLTVTANAASMTYGGSLPMLTASYSGFANGDGQGVLSGSPSLTTTATSGSPVGTYPITADQGTLSAQNYSFTFVGGVLTIQPASSSATLTSSSGSLYTTQAITLTAMVSVTGSGGAPTGTVNFMLGPTLLGTGTLLATDGTDAAVAMRLFGSQLTVGPNSITAVYSGDSNYSGSSAPPITVTLLSPDLGFGAVNVGTAAPVQRLTYTFNLDVTLSAIDILTRGVTGLDYTDGGDSTCAVGTPYMAGQSCTVAVAFTPAAPGERAGAVMLFAQGSNLPLMTWYVNGIGESAAVTIDPGTQTTLASLASALTYGSAIDGAGNVYVSDNLNGQVIRVAAGTLLQSTVINGLSAPTSVALDGGGNLYIAENSGVIMVPNENGTLNSADVVQVSINGLGVPQGIALDGNGNLYVTDSSNGDVLRVPAGDGLPVMVASGLINPHAVAVDPAGDVYVASDNQVSEYPAGGGSAIPLGSGYNSPHGIAVDASGTVYVADTGNSQIVEVATGGGSQSVLAVAGITAPHGVTVDSAGNLFVSDNTSVYEVNRTQAASLNFGIENVGSTSPAQMLTVSNVGNQQLAVSGLSISPNFTQQPSGGTDCSSNSRLVAGGACASALAFAPTTTGVLNGTLTLTDNALNNPASMQSASMSGIGTQQQQQEPQTITFPNPGTQTYGVVPIALTATASSGLPVTYTVISGPAMVSGNVLTIIGAGLVTVEADQPGNEDWLPAPPVRDSFTVNKAVLTVTANAASMTYGGSPPLLTASYSGFVNGDGQGVLSGSPSLTTTATSGSPVGPYPIMAAQGTLSAANYTFTFVNGTLTINQAVLTVTANNASIPDGSLLPTFTASYSGFVNGDGIGVLSGSPSLTTTAPQNPPVGTYPIIGAQGTLSAQNYTFTFVSGTLTVTAVTAQITSPAKGSRLTGTTVTFTWSHESGATSYQLWVGSTAGAHDIALSTTSSLTTTVTGLPANGSQVYVTLYGYSGGGWTVQDTATYTAAGGINRIR
jgi:sugar lactone lactonase YvrE